MMGYMRCLSSNQLFNYQSVVLVVVVYAATGERRYRTKRKLVRSYTDSGATIRYE